jgi:hypothetical protein
MNDCPFCDHKGGFSQELAWHIGYRHTDRADPYGEGRFQSGLMCWCGQGPLSYHVGPFDALSQFAVHLQRHGGAAAHWLEHALGLAVKE